MLPAQRSHVKASRRTIATHSTGRLRRPSAALAVACSLGAHAPFAPESLRTLRQARQRHPLRPGQLRSGRARTGDRRPAAARYASAVAWPAAPRPAAHQRRAEGPPRSSTTTASCSTPATAAADRDEPPAGLPVGHVPRPARRRLPLHPPDAPVVRAALIRAMLTRCEQHCAGDRGGNAGALPCAEPLHQHELG